MPRLQKRAGSANNDDGLFDDCPICRAMRTATARGRGLTSDELRTAFQRAKDAGGTVGGEWIDAGER